MAPRSDVLGKRYSITPIKRSTPGGKTTSAAPRISYELSAFPNLADRRNARDRCVDRFYLRFVGWRHPFAKYIGAYNHHVTALGEFIEYKLDPKRFYDEHSAAALSFDCERIRDDLVKLSQSIISPELAISAETTVWREGRTLHLGDRSVAGTEAFAAWKNQISKLATTEHPREAGHYGTLLQALFASVTIHGGNAGEDFSVDTKRDGESDACE